MKDWFIKHKETIHVIASISTIIGLIIAIFLYNNDLCVRRQIETEEYISKITSLQFELWLNQKEIAFKILDNKERFLTGEHIPILRYSTFSINEQMRKGDIRNLSLVNDVYDIGARINRANNFLDSATLAYSTFEFPLEEPTKSLVRFRIAQYMEFVVNDTKSLNESIPILLRNLEWHKQQISSNKPLRCKISVS